MPEYEWQPTRIHIRTSVGSFWHGIDLGIFAVDETIRPLVSKVAVLQWQDYEPGSWDVPKVHLEKQQAQELMDSLWACGVKPNEIKVSEGRQAATEKHLEDMRVIAFNRLKIERGE